MPSGIICEYNPFHNGHLYQINKIREESDEPVICVMSGNFTQRGELAVTDKYARAKTAVDSGADLVLELPFPYCVSSAEFFASAGVAVLSSVGVDKISFGSETLDAQGVRILADIVRSEKFRRLYYDRAKKEGNTVSYFSVLSELSGDNINLLSNDILAIEYAKAILDKNISMELCPVKREGTSYLDLSLCKGRLPSASAIRDKLVNGKIKDIAEFVPATTFDMLENENIADINNIGYGILLLLRLLNGKDTDNVAISDKGLVSRIIQSARSARNFFEFEDLVQTKKYTKSSVRRAMWYLLAGVTFDDLKSEPAYTTLLGANSRGRKILSDIRKSDISIPIVTKPADYKDLNNKRANRQSELSSVADSIYSLALREKKTSFEYMKRSPYML